MKERNICRREFFNILGFAALGKVALESLRFTPNAASKTALVYGDIYLKHKTGDFHPESPLRLESILNGLKEASLLASLKLIEPYKASIEWIELVHTREYIEIVRRDVLSGAERLSTRSGNTFISKDSFEVALWAVGGVLNACDQVISRKVRNAFCAIRPPGHHATPNRGMGFCLFNNAAIAARYIQVKHKLERILIVDWDVHHGNGTQDIFYEDPYVFYFSTHQWPWYPWTGSEEETGRGKGRGTTLNVPLPAGSGDRELIQAFEKKLCPRMEEFKPNFIIVSAGFDSRSNDPLGRFRVTDEGFRKLTEIMVEIANVHSAGRLVSILEGGYSLKGLSQVVPAHLKTLLKG